MLGRIKEFSVEIAVRKPVKVCAACSGAMQGKTKDISRTFLVHGDVGSVHRSEHRGWGGRQPQLFVVCEPRWRGQRANKFTGTGSFHMVMPQGHTSTALRDQYRLVGILYMFKCQSLSTDV